MITSVPAVAASSPERRLHVCDGGAIVEPVAVEHITHAVEDLVGLVQAGPCAEGVGLLSRDVEEALGLQPLVLRAAAVDLLSTEETSHHREDKRREDILS